MILQTGVRIGVVFGVLITIVAYMTLAERKVSAWMQDRYGPNRVGPRGLLQPFADVLKLLLKEDITPRHVDRWLYTLAPAMIVIFALTAFSVIPFHPSFVIADIPVAVLFLLAAASMDTYGLILAGWASHSKYPLLGGLRSAAQVISYELPVALSFASVVVLTGSFSLLDIQDFQHRYVWLLIPNILGFVIHLVAAFAETNRAPFDLPEAESELVGGYHTEYASMRWALFFLGEYLNMAVAASVITVLYLGGWYGPFQPGFWWFFLKVAAILFLYLWVRFTFPRFRYDQLMNLCWKVLIPLGLVNLIWVTALRLWLF